jgi:hypothetical protein
MRSYGISKKIAQMEFQKALERGYAVGAMRPSRQVRPISRYAEICTRWYIDKSFVDSAGKPKALTWNGKTGTLRNLVTLVVGRKASNEVIREMIARRLLKKTRAQAWLPKSKVVAPSGLDRAQVLRTATMMERLLRTIAYNSALRYRGDVLLDVMAQVPRLPARHLRQFKKYTKAQGLIFARTVDDWLESRDLKRASAKDPKTLEAGIVAFAFQQPSQK